MASFELPSHIVDALKVFSLKNNFKTPKFEYFEGSDKGFIGLIKRCHVSEGDRKLSVICKFLPDDPELNTRYESYELFRREVFVYQNFLPQIEKIQLENGLELNDSEGFWSVPKCYGSNFDEDQPEKSFILMEDLSDENFVMNDAHKPSDFAHTKKLFVELGKFHAISFVLKEKKPKVFEEFKSLNDLMCRLMTTETMKDLAPRNCQLASELFNLPEENLKREKILLCKSNLWEQIRKLLEGNSTVVCHGDCWVNNILYNYVDEEKKEIKKICLIDWQMTRFGSGASELMYFLFCSADKKLRDDHKEELFEAYYEAMKKFLKVFGIEINEVFPRQLFHEELRKFGKFAFAMASFAMPILCKYPEKLFADKNAELTTDEKEAVDLYAKLMKDVVNDLVAMKAF